MAIPHYRPFSGPAILSHGFRPFFFLGAFYAGASVMLWLPQFYGELELATVFAGVDWHAHEMFFGFLAAVLTGFLFTAVPNWTGRMPIVGLPLLALVLLWLGGRIAVTFSVYTGWLVAMLIDVSFLGAVLVVIAIEIVAGKNWRNLRILLPLGLLVAANAGFHLEAHFTGATDFSRRGAMAAAIILIMIIGGRIIPSFTRNWLVQHNPGRMPASFSRFDMIALATGVLAFALWIGLPDYALSGVILALAAWLHFVRLNRWAGMRALAEPMVICLHVGYLFVPIGFAFLAANIFWPGTVPAAAGTHAFGAGAIGTMTLSVMLRASLGHSGRAIKAGGLIKLILAALLVSVTVRILAALLPDVAFLALHIAAFGWVLAFTGFALGFAPVLFGRSRSN